MPTATSAAFWTLMDRWRIPDLDALRLIDQAPSPSGKRPRFDRPAMAFDIDQRLDG